jgi:dolichol-phosphate mannosyltransferase
MWSIVVPVYNEHESLRQLADRIAEVAQEEGCLYELIMIDDGSSDGSWELICELASRCDKLRGLRFRRNFGKAAALDAGFELAAGQRVLTLDADLQDDPQEIPKLLSQLDQGYDVVSGWKKVRHDPWHKVIPSRFFNAMISWLTGVHLHDHNCGFKAYRRNVLDEIQLYGEMHRFVPVLAAARGFRVTEVVVHHQPRRHGHSKYGFERFMKGFLDLLTVYFLTGYGSRPQHLLGTVGLSSFLVSLVGLLTLSVMWVVSRLSDMPDVHLHEKAIFYFCILGLLFGAQLVSIGFIAELITARDRQTEKAYSIAADTRPTKTLEASAGPGDSSS